MNPDEYPADWIPGQLLNLRKYSDGTYVATQLHEDPNPEKTNCKFFSNTWEAQDFISWWYARGLARDERFTPSRGAPGYGAAFGAGEVTDTDRPVAETPAGTRTWEKQNGIHPTAGNRDPATQNRPRPVKRRSHGSW